MSDDPNFRFNNGDVVKDEITSYQGVIVGRIHWLNGCIRYVVQANKLDKDGEPIKEQTFDEQLLLLVSERKVNREKKTGGPRTTPSRGMTVRR